MILKGSFQWQNWVFKLQARLLKEAVYVTVFVALLLLICPMILSCLVRGKVAQSL